MAHLKEPIISKIKDIEIDLMPKIWEQFDDVTIQRIKNLENPIASMFFSGSTLIVEYWNSDKYKESWTIELENAHITDDGLAYYFNSLALFINEINPEMVLLDNSFYGMVCVETEDDFEMVFDEDLYIEEMVYKTVGQIVEEIGEGY